MSPILKDQVAVVTGGMRGIGRAIAEGLATEGATVVLSDLDSEATQAVAAEIAGQTGATVEGVACDVSQVDNCSTLVQETAKKHGRLDILVNNAGITRDGLLARMSAEDFQAVLDVNLRSVYACSKVAARLMVRQRSGRIISIASVVGLVGNPGQCNYAASKAGIIGFSKSLAREIGSRGVTVNCIAPGFIDTTMTKSLPEAVKEEMLKQIPLGRLGQPQDVAAAVVFLASPAAGYITGEVLRVGGGMAM